ncbi:probable inactive receptor kinase At2g26730 [Morus notabilis]|uniref:probable inactive receptor kinase At2g26730 n=1 Tax=Morus notabilis TaxID=981085 RepID=UPI000CED001B|nr:probable inactive receptor kinase At2g26730 [Morus notabilis]
MAKSSPLPFKYFLVITSLLLLRSFSLAQNDSPALGYSVKERQALYALKAVFNSPFLNGVWNGPHCYNNASQWYGVRCNSNGHVTEIALDNMELRGNIRSNAFTGFTELSVLSLKSNSVSGTEIDFSPNRNLTRVDLSGNMFSGQIPISLVGISVLESLLLQGNYFTGTIPEFNQSSLKEFDVSNNNLSGSIPKTRALQLFGRDSYDGNPGLCGPPSSTPCNSIKHDAAAEAPSDEKTDQGSFLQSLKHNLKAILLLLNAVLIALVIFLCLFYYNKARKLKKMTREYKEREELRTEKSELDQLNITEVEGDHNRQRSRAISNNIRNNISGQGRGKLVFMADNNNHGQGSNSTFDMSDLLKASAEGLGQGTFGNCYKAMMEGKPVVVVKRLKNLKPMTDDEFSKQLLVIANLNHPNLLSFLAYYNRKDEKLLLYKYVERGNLFDRLHGGRRKGEKIPFRWAGRLNVARGVARAMEYLHLNTTFLAPHGNLKSTNVLLDSNDIALVSDYCLGSLAALPVAAQRTVSYRSPEYQSTRRVSKKSDVWSYGCLLLELLTGKIGAYTAPPGVRGVDLCTWVQKAIREEWTAEIFDAEIAVNRRSAVPGMLRLLEIALHCVEKSPEKRPEMAEVAREVEEIQFLDQSEDENDQSLERSYTTDDSISSVASGKAGDIDQK